MNDTVKSLYRGTIFPIEKCGMNNDEIKELTKLLNTTFDKMRANLSKIHTELLEELEEITIKLNMLYNEEFFTEGFKLGFKLATESLLT